MMTSDYALATQRLMSKLSDEALTHFTELNPNMQGCHWADALSIMIDTDAHTPEREQIYEALSPLVAHSHVAFITPVLLTLIYARKGHVPFALEVAYQVGKVGALYDEAIEEGGEPSEQD